MRILLLLGRRFQGRPLLLLHVLGGQHRKKDIDTENNHEIGLQGSDLDEHLVHPALYFLWAILLDGSRLVFWSIEVLRLLLPGVSLAHLRRQLLDALLQRRQELRRQVRLCIPARLVDLQIMVGTRLPHLIHPSLEGRVAHQVRRLHRHQVARGDRRRQGGALRRGRLLRNLLPAARAAVAARARRSLRCGRLLCNPLPAARAAVAVAALARRRRSRRRRARRA